MSNMTFEISSLDTSVSDPWSPYSDWQSALRVRHEWMRMMGLDDDEIAEKCAESPPTDFDEELAHYNAMFDIRRMNQDSRERR